MLQNAIIIDEKDNVATALVRLEKGDETIVAIADGDLKIVLVEMIPFGHKLAVQDIEKGGPVIKFGEIIGNATCRISKGFCVHVHNVEGIKGRGDR